ncbi:tyrosine-type recombinase/integrase [Blautia schinkii]|nr:tyrosine-type recombinase/integrase [Blautia schinkii]
MNIQEHVIPYLEYCKYRKELDDKTVKAYRIDLRQFFDFVQSSVPEKKNIEDFITDLHKKYKQKTIKRKLASIKAFYNYLEDEEFIEENPFRKIKVKFKEEIVLPRIIMREEIETLLNYMYKCACNAKKYSLWLRDIAVVETFFATGARVYEVSNIKKDCIDLNTGLICFKGKGNKERYVQIGSKDVLELLKRYHDANIEAINKSGYFFVNSRGERFTEQSIRIMIKRYTEEVGIERKITPHMFRHSVATFLIEEEVDISCVQRILGHSSIKTTQIYIHVAAKRQAEILREKHPRNKMRINTAA